MRNVKIFDLCCSVRGGRVGEVRDLTSVLERQSLSPHHTTLSYQDHTPHLTAPQRTTQNRNELRKIGIFFTAMKTQPYEDFSLEDVTANSLLTKGHSGKILNEFLIKE